MESKKTDKKQTASRATKKTDPKSSKQKESPYGELQTFGRPRRFATEEDFLSAYYMYTKNCYDKQLLPNIAGFCTFADITKDTFYSQARYFPDGYKKVRGALEDSLINHNKYGQNNPAMAIVQGKSTFRWDDTGKGGGDSSFIDVDFDADSEELDTFMSKLGYLPKPDDPESE